MTDAYCTVEKAAELIGTSAKVVRQMVRKGYFHTTVGDNPKAGQIGRRHQVTLVLIEDVRLYGDARRGYRALLRSAE